MLNVKYHRPFRRLELCAKRRFGSVAGSLIAENDSTEAFAGG